jgi:hypothetical protein
MSPGERPREMSIWEILTACAAIGQLVVIGGGLVFAYLQVRGLRRQQEAELIRHIFEELNRDEIARALDFVYRDLSERLKQQAYAREIAEGRATVMTHPELAVMHLFNELGLLVHEKMVSENSIVPFIATPCMRAWDHLAPVVELMRRRYAHAYTPFESLVVRSRAIDLARINGRFRAETPQLRTHWEGTARDLIAKRILLPEDT